MRIVRTHGIDELRKRRAKEAADRGLTLEQLTAAHSVDWMLDMARRGDTFKIPAYGLAGIREYAERASVKIDKQLAKYEKPDDRHSHDDRANELATMRIALETLIERLELDQYAMLNSPREKGPDSSELCGGCRERIEQRYLQPLDSDRAKALRLYFPIKERNDRRALYIRSAWQVARQHKLFPSKHSFAEHAKSKLGRRPALRSILNYIEEDSASPTDSAQQIEAQRTGESR